MSDLQLDAVISKSEVSLEVLATRWTGGAYYRLVAFNYADTVVLLRAIAKIREATHDHEAGSLTLMLLPFGARCAVGLLRRRDMPVETLADILHFAGDPARLAAVDVLASEPLENLLTVVQTTLAGVAHQKAVQEN